MTSMLSRVLLSIGQPETAAELLGAADSLREMFGAAPAEHERVLVLQVQSGLRDALGETVLNIALARGRGAGPDQAVNLVQEAVSALRPD
jgi:hypothetical protein